MTGFEELLGAITVSARKFIVRAVSEGESRVLDAEAEPIALYVLAGSGLLRSPRQLADSFARDGFMLVPAGRAARIEACSNVLVAQGDVVATFGGVAGPFDGLRAPLMASFAARPMRESFLALVDELASPGVGSRAIVECIVKQALVTLMREQLRAGREAALPWIVALRDDRLGRAVAAMLERPSDPWSLETLAQRAGMSRSAFAERFGAAFAQSPIEFLRDIRLGRAAHLLASTDLPVKRIASAVGYGSRSYFSRAFRSRYDIDPSDYRVSRLNAA